LEAVLEASNPQEGQMKLTQANVAKIVPEPGKFESRFWDDTLADFGVRVWNPKKPKRVWIIQYRRLNGKTTTHKIGPCERISAGVARDLAKQKLAQAELAKIGKAPDPGKEHQVNRHQASETFDTIAARFLQQKQKAVKPSSFDQIKTHLTKHWSNFNGRSVHQISRRDVATRLGEIADQRGDYAANRAGGTLSNFFAWLMQQGIVEANPVIGTGRKTEKARDRVLSDGELAAIWKACQPNDYGDIVRLLILTGQRRDEVGAMQRDELELAGKAPKWLIPGNRTKNGRPHEVPLSDPAVAILKTATTRPGREDREAVFGDKIDGSGFRGYSKGKAKLDKRIAEQTKKKVAPWRIHDLRRTAATRMADIGIQPHIIEAALNHISGHKSGVAGVYNRSVYSAATRAALDMWAAHVEALIAGKPGSNVVAITR
jgi:integrase